MKYWTLCAMALALWIPSAASAADVLEVYPLDTCAVAKTSKLGSMGDPIIYEHEGREVRFCCKKCQPKFEKDPEKFLASIDARIIEAQKAHYPLQTCVVSGEPLEDDAKSFVVNNRMMRTCCGMCMRKVKGDPAKFLKALDTAIVAQQQKEYPLETCVVSKEKLGSMGEPIDMIVGNRLVRLCCKGCKKQLAAEPQKALAAVEEAWAAKKPTLGENKGKKAEKAGEKKKSGSGRGTPSKPGAKR